MDISVLCAGNVFEQREFGVLFRGFVVFERKRKRSDKRGSREYSGF